MGNPYSGYVVRIDRLFTGDWRVRLVDRVTLTPVPHQATGTFSNRTAARSVAETLSKWFDIEIEEVTP